MSELLPPAIVRFLADTSSLTRGISESEGRMQAMNKTLSTFGKASAAALVVAGAESVHMAMNFDAAMERVHTQAGASQQEVEKLKSSVLGLAGKTGQAPEQLAEGLYHLESAGFRGAQALDILNNAAKLAAIGNANLEDVSQAMIATVASGIPGVHGMADAAALLNTTVGIGDMKMQQLTKAIATGILPSARVAGLSFNDVAAALATVTDNATPADETATRLRMTISMMSAPTHAAAKALGTIGMSSTQMGDDMRKPNGLLVALQDLQAHLKASGMSATEQSGVLARAFGGGKTSGTILLLLTQMDRLKDKYGELGTSGDRAAKFQESWAATQKTFKNEVDRLRASAEVLGIKLGTWLIPKLEAVARFFASHQNITKGIIAAIGALMAISIAVWMGNVAKAAAEMGKAVLLAAKKFILAGEESEAAFAVNPVFLVIAAIALLAVAIYEIIKHWSTVKRWLSDFWGWMRIGWHDTIGWLKKNWEIVAAVLILPLAPVLLAWRFFHKQIVGAAQATWRFLQPIFRGIATGLNILLIPVRLLAFLWIWAFKTIIAPLVLWLWSSVVRPTFHFIADAFTAILGVALKLFLATWRSVWGVVGAVARWAWQNVLSPTFHLISVAFDATIGLALRVLRKAWDLNWAAMRATVDVVWKFLKPIFDVIGKGLGLLGGAAGKVGGFVGHLNKVLPFADGGSPPVGRAVLVGERGPELAVFGGPAYIHPAGETRSIVAGGRASGGWVGQSSAWGGGGSSGGSGSSPSLPDIVLQVDGQTLFRIVQKQSLRYNKRNPTNGMASVIGI